MNFYLHICTILSVLLALAGLGIIVHILLLEAPIHFGILYADYPDPSRPGHLKGLTVSTLELSAKTMLALVTLSLAALLSLFVRSKGGLGAKRSRP